MRKETERKRAVALAYDEKKREAPHVSAKGEGDAAERIIRLAEQHEVPIQEDPSLVAVLSELNINESIPPDLYQVVAEVFAFVYRLEQDFAASKK
ncbi:MAG TPA: EscU/YscU/HrcU family type III secretion system export apparatus switch protein [Bacillales bacterium]|nr:EscU/YscU/HrcU family type III secretion system export apparatus switch protein [Bacillales bacterium]